jgi:hypothetical protein
MRNYYVNEGNHIGGQEAQSLGVDQARLKASADTVKGQVVEISGSWTVAPASADSAKVAGIAFNDALNGEKIVVDTEGFVKVDFTGTVNPGDKVVSSGAGKVKAKGASAGDVLGVVYAINGTVAYIKLAL